MTGKMKLLASEIFIALWMFLGCPVQPALAQWDRTYIGVNYKGFPQSIAEIDRDLAVLGPHFGYIRTYISLFAPQKAIPSRVELYNQHHPATPVKVAMGVALTPNNPAASQAELDAVITLAKTYPGVVNAVVVGNENFGVDPKISFTEQQLISYINYAKTQLKGTAVAVTTCQQWGVLFGHPNLVNACSSYALANIYPYFDGPGYQGGSAAKAGADTLKNWQSRFLAAYNQLAVKYPGKIRIGETGWPSGGSQVIIDGHYTGIPSQTAALPNEQTYIEQYARWAGAKNLFSYLFSAIDEAWKTEPGNVGSHFGLYTASDVAKWPLGQLPAVNAGSTLWLGNDSPYGDLAFNGGTLLIIDRHTDWPNGFNIAAGTTSALDNGGNSLLHAGPLTGSGNLVLSGAGTTSHFGDGANFSGTYNVAAGTLNLASSLGAVQAPCAVMVNPGGILTGTGPVVGRLTNQGLVNPGNSPGTLNISGSYTQTGTGKLAVEIASPDNYDQIIVTGSPGTASLAGAVAPILPGGYRPQGNTVFPGVVTTAGDLTGTFDTVFHQQLSPTRFWQLRYRAQSFDLVVQRDYANRTLGLNSNQLNVGTMLNGLAGAASGDLDACLNALDNLPDSGSVRAAFKQISPEKAGALANLGFAAAAFQVRHLATRTTNLRFLQGAHAANRRGLGSLQANGSGTAGLMLAYNGGALADLFSPRREFQVPGSRWGFFLDGGAALGSQNSSVNQTGYAFTLGGLTLGADYRLQDNLLVGLALGYSHTRAGFYGSGSDVHTDTMPVNAYVAYFPGPLYVYGSLGYALNLYNLKRDLDIGNRSRQATSATAGHQFNLYGETGHDFTWGRSILTPAVTLAYSALWLNGFSERGAGALNLQVGPQSASSLQTGLGGRLTVPLQVGGVNVVPQGYAFYQHECANGSRGLNARLGQGSTFNFQTDAAGRNFALLGASLIAGLKQNLSGQVNYTAEVGRAHSTVHYVNAGLRYEF